MFDIGATELLLIIVVAVIVIGPKDMPMALRTAGRWIGKLRRMSGHFRAGLDAMVREAEMEDMQKDWDRRNAEIMARHPATDPETGRLTGASGPSSKTAGAEVEPAAESSGNPPSVTGPAPKPGTRPLPLFDDADANGHAASKPGGRED